LADFVTLARTARESLAQGLNALQADPRLPPHLVDLAAPIAQAMGALHRIEASGGTQLAGNATAALANIQSALASLQAQPPTVPAVAAAMEAVAGALGSVHALARESQQMAAAPAAAPSAQPPASMQQAPSQQAPRSVAQQQPFQPQYAPVPAPQPQAQPQPQYAQQQAQAYAPPQQAYPQAAQAAPQYAQAPQQAAQARGGYPAQAAPQGGGFEVVAAELGAHSPSNFYKGLSGNDIVDHGGLFVSTYKLPKLGAPVRVRVSLPGGYEFEANAVVRWRREPSDGGSDAPPGFGAQFTEITPEARQLVYRYTRNREPMFHDDL
jgi:hypothetical protein